MNSYSFLGSQGHACSTHGEEAKEGSNQRSAFERVHHLTRRL